ncbi:MAG: hypothetical protein KatS3mg087_1245 [Patescibacteria group bacterium]|nr:MAG: hypothetical protein KatS3mg087_1245 [Patescibacteria group bacterium]
MRALFYLAAFLISAPPTILLVVLTLNISQNPENLKVYYQEGHISLGLFRATQSSKGEVQGLATVQDARVVLIRNFFARYNSPLREHAAHIVEMADKYQIDYRLIPAISMQESTGCKFIPENSYNCWGYGIYGNKVTRFSSYQEGIETVSRGLKKNYYDQGLTTPQQIMAKYTPPSIALGGPWARGVYYFFNEIESGN